jgi:hypothetical protein
MITVNLGKAKVIAHGIRRETRAAEFMPLDAQVNINIANAAKLAEIEAQRQAIRDKHAAIQTAIDKANTVGVLAEIVSSL